MIFLGFVLGGVAVTCSFLAYNEPDFYGFWVVIGFAASIAAVIINFVEQERIEELIQAASSKPVDKRSRECDENS